MYFIEHLTLRAWLLKVLPRLLLRQDGAVHVCYAVDASRFALAVAKMTARLAGVSVERLTFRMVDIRDKTGLLIRLRIANRDLFELQADTTSNPRFLAFLRTENGQSRLHTYLAKSVVTTSLSDRGTLWRALLLVQICTWKTRKEGNENHAAFFIESRPWMPAVERYASRYGIGVVAAGQSVDFSRIARGALTPRGVAWARAVRDCLRLYRLRLRRERQHVAGNLLPASGASAALQPSAVIAPRGKPRIAVEYYGQFNLSQPERYSDLFFWQQSRLPASDLLVVFGLPQDPLDGDKWSQLRREGIAAIALRPDATTIPSAPAFVHRPRLSEFKPVSNGFRASPLDSEGRWLRQRVQSYQVLREHWERFFSNQNVKIYVTWFRYDESHCAIADALNILGGLLVIYQRACQPDPSPEITVDADVMFGYAPFDAGVERRSGSNIRYHVSVGYLGDHRFPLLRETAKEVRNRLERNGAEFVLAFFDENSADDSRWHTGHEFQRENYEFLLRKVLSERKLGLVLKPKVPSTLRRRLGPASPLLEQVLTTGRCCLYESGPLHGSYPPAAAALSADIAIHGHLCAATAGFESALAGVPTLLLDREGWPPSPLYRLGIGRVVFTNWEDLWQAVMNHWSRPGGIPGFGDWSPMLDELDPFRDGRAAERMGTYIQWLIEGFKAGLDRETVMADVAERYCAAWGQDKIVEVRGDPSTSQAVTSNYTESLRAPRSSF